MKFNFRGTIRRNGNNGQDTKLSIKERFQALKNLPRFFLLIWNVNSRLTLINIILRVFKSAVPLAALYIGKLIIDEVVFLTTNTGADNIEHLLTLIAVEFAIALISDVLNRGIALSDSLLGDLFSNESSIRIMKHAADMDLDQFEDSEFYDKLERARRQTLSRTVLMSQVLSQVQDIITILFLAAGLIVFNFWLIVLLIVAVIPAFLGESHFNEKTYSLVHGWTPERRELDYLRFTGASDETAKEIKIFGLSNFLTDRFKFLSDKYFSANKSIAVSRAGWGLLFASIGSIGYYAAYLVIIINTVKGNLSIGDLTFLAGSFGRLRGLLESLLNKFSSISEGALYLKDFFDFFDLKPKIRASENMLPFPKIIREGFIFENVGFRYQGSEKWAVKDLNFILKAGEKLALVGENGAGKTTVVKLISRLYDPTEGRILLDGKDLRSYDPAQLRKEVGVIFQDYVKFQMTAGTNIAVGRIEEQENMSRITDSARRSLAESVISTLPKGYDQRIGRRFTDGIELSGGQWQKIALGRAYMRDAQLLILDEPTAALDARAEYEIFQRFAELTIGKTVILISHRFSTVRMADRILVLENGRLAEIGTHNELLEKDGMYADLFNLQARGYR